MLAPKAVGPRPSLASMNKSLAQIDKTLDHRHRFIGTGLMKGLARSTAFNWASHIRLSKKNVIDEGICKGQVLAGDGLFRGVPESSGSDTAEQSWFE